MDMPSVIEDVKKGAIMAGYSLVASSVIDSTQKFLGDLTGPKHKDGKQAEDRGAINRVIESGPGRAGIAYVLGVGAQQLITKAPSPNMAGMVDKFSSTLRVGAFMQLFSSAINSAIDPILVGVKKKLEKS